MRPAARAQNVGTYLPKYPFQTASQWDLLPGGHQIKGVNIAARNVFAPDYSCWADMWVNWEWSNGGSPGSTGNWIKWQIDQAKALGANTIRFFSTQYGRPGSGSGYATPISTATYLAQWDQLANYLRSQGMYLYPVLGNDTSFEDFGTYLYTTNQAWWTGEAILLARYLQKHADIIPGVDIHNEATNWANTAATGPTVYLALKQAAPLLKYTWSCADVAKRPPASSYDYFEFHVYSGQVATFFDTLLSTNNLPVMMGEFGSAITNSTGTRQALYNSVAGMHASVTGGRRVAGSICWTAAPQDAAGLSSADFGLWDSSGNARTDVTPIFQGMAA
jgi:hypothetical protein